MNILKLQRYVERVSKHYYSLFLDMNTNGVRHIRMYPRGTTEHCTGRMPVHATAMQFCEAFDECHRIRQAYKGKW